MIFPDLTTTDRKSRIALLSIIAVSVALRVASALLQGNEVVPLPGTYDQVSYDALARRVADGQGFSFGHDAWPLTRANEPTAHWSYLYTLYLAGVYTLFGAQPIIARVIQAILVGVLLPLFTYRLGRRAFGDAAGLLAAAISSVYLYFVYYGGALMTEPFYIVAILASLDIATGRLASPATVGRRFWSSWLLLGLCLGLAVLLRQLFLLLVPLILGWIVWTQARASGSGLGYLRRPATYAGPLLAVGIILMLILPWTIRNYRAFHRFVLLNTNAGYALYWGNHPIYGTHFVGILPEDGVSYQELVPVELRSLDEAALDQALMREAMQLILAEPGRYVLLSISRTPEYFKFWPSGESSFLSNISRTASFALLLPFAMSGLFLAYLRREWLAQTGHWPTVTLFYLFITAYTLIHLLSWALIRYRLPVDAVLMPFAAFAITSLLLRLPLPWRVRRAVSTLDIQS